MVARRRPSRTRRASITLSLYPSREAQDDDFDRDNNVKTDSCIDDLEAGKPRHTTFLSRGHHNRQSRIVPSTRTSILDVAKGRVTMLGFLDEKTSSRRLGFHQRSEQSNIEKMEKVFPQLLIKLYCWELFNVILFYNLAGSVTSYEVFI